MSKAKQIANSNTFSIQDSYFSFLGRRFRVSGQLGTSAVPQIFMEQSSVCSGVAVYQNGSVNMRKPEGSTFLYIRMEMVNCCYNNTKSQILFCGSCHWYLSSTGCAPWCACSCDQAHCSIRSPWHLPQLGVGVSTCTSNQQETGHGVLDQVTGGVNLLLMLITLKDNSITTA